MSKEKLDLFKIIQFNQWGLIPVIVQDCENDQILMMAWMNEQSLRLTLKKKTAHYFSRSRQKLWRKGEISGQVQKVKELFLDCDGDCLLLKVKQTGVACHTGRKSCFFYKIDKNGKIKINQKIIVKSEILYDKD